MMQKNILLAGATGYLGSYLLKILIEKQNQSLLLFVTLNLCQVIMKTI
jgi:thioester reductase-like protein